MIHGDARAGQSPCKPTVRRRATWIEDSADISFGAVAHGRKQDLRRSFIRNDVGAYALASQPPSGPWADRRDLARTENAGVEFHRGETCPATANSVNRREDRPGILLEPPDRLIKLRRLGREFDPGGYTGNRDRPGNGEHLAKIAKARAWTRHDDAFTREWSRVPGTVGLGKSGGPADDGDYGWAQILAVGLIGNRLQRTHDKPLPRRRGPLDAGCRRRPVTSRLDQRTRDIT